MSLIGIKQAQTYTKNTGINIRRTDDPMKLKFGDDERKNDGVFNIRITLTNYSQITMRVHVVCADITILIVIEVLQKEGIILEFWVKCIKNKRRGWKVPMTYTFGHVFPKCNRNKIHYNHAEHQRPHLELGKGTLRVVICPHDISDNSNRITGRF